MTFGKRMKQVREDLNKGQAEFASDLGMSRDAYANIEYDRLKNLQSKETVILLVCKKFGVNESWLRTGQGEMFSPPQEDDRYSINLGKLSRSENQFVQNAINYLAETDPDKLKIIEEFMKGCLGIKD